MKDQAQRLERWRRRPSRREGRESLLFQSISPAYFSSIVIVIIIIMREKRKEGDSEMRGGGGGGKADRGGGRELPRELWVLVASHVNQSDMLAFVLTCKQFKEILLPARQLKTKLSRTCFGQERMSRDCLKWLFTSSNSMDRGRAKAQLRSHVVCLASYNGYLDLLKWMKARRGPIRDKRTCSSAALGGHLHVLKWLRLHASCPWDEDTCSFAAYRGHLDILIWARQHRCPWKREETCEFAELGGQLAILQYIGL